MLKNLPENTFEFSKLEWSHIEPFYHELQNYPLKPNNLTEWMTTWSRIEELISETYSRLYVATTLDTADKDAENQYQAFLNDIYQNAESANEILIKKLLKSELKPDNFDIPLRNMRIKDEIFREENLELLADELKLNNENDRIYGAQTVEWEGKELTLLQLQPVYMDPDRQKRERVWHLAMQRQLKDRHAINELWQEFFRLRSSIAAHAGFENYREYRWKQLQRFDYTPRDCFNFHQAIEEVIVPAAERIYEKRRLRLGLQSLRPWDLDVDPFGFPPLQPFRETFELESKASTIFHRVDSQLGGFFDLMRTEDLLDLENRKGKATGGYCEMFAHIRRPFIFMNAVGIHDDVQTILHEAGHAFHVFETAHLPYIQQLDVGLEIAEVASTSMELLASPYLEEKYGGYYTARDSARARIKFLEDTICFLPYMAVVDAFQHWAYANPDRALIPNHCDEEWVKLWKRFMRGVNWDDLDLELASGWQRKSHIHQVPFYYIEYGIAQLGSFQVWKNSLQDYPKAVTAYRKALSLGNTASLPELFQTAGANFSFDSAMLQETVRLAEGMISELETGLH